MDLVMMVLGIVVAWIFVAWLMERPRELRDERDLAERLVPERSPELLKAIELAESTLPYFLEQLASGRSGFHIRFLYSERTMTLSIWGEVWGRDGDFFTVNLRGSEIPKDSRGFPFFQIYEEVIQVASYDVNDWKFVHEDGRIEGGHTEIGRLRYLERRGFTLSEGLKVYKARFVDYDAPSLPLSE